MIRFVILTLSVLLASVAHAQMSNPLTPGIPCYLCIESKPATTWQHPAPTYNYSNNYGADFYVPRQDERTSPDRVPSQSRYRHKLNKTKPARPRAYDMWYPTLELQMQFDTLETLRDIEWNQRQYDQ
ncbi:MAG: hypothetical protein OXL95_11855 [Nitrospira sp.]|nr:hypothetical protein [Nitrospira sp.]